jgi:hypothetical protein
VSSPWRTDSKLFFYGEKKAFFRLKPQNIGLFGKNYGKKITDIITFANEKKFFNGIIVDQKRIIRINLN